MREVTCFPCSESMLKQPADRHLASRERLPKGRERLIVIFLTVNWTINTLKNHQFLWNWLMWVCYEIQFYFPCADMLGVWAGKFPYQTLDVSNVPRWYSSYKWPTDLPPIALGLLHPAVQCGGHEPHVETGHLKHGWSEPRRAVSIKYTPDFKDSVTEKRM